jgi:hypothetical protein
MAASCGGRPAAVGLTELHDSRDRQLALDREQKDVERRIARLVTAVETGGHTASLIAKLRDLEARRTAIDTERAQLQPIPRLAPAVIEDRLSEWRRLLRQSTTQARAVLQRVLRGRIVFTPSGTGYTFEAPTRFDKLFSGMVIRWLPGKRTSFIPEGDTTGTEGITPEDTGEADYGRLLERASANAKGMASPPGFAWP